MLQGGVRRPNQPILTLTLKLSFNPQHFEVVRISQNGPTSQNVLTLLVEWVFWTHAHLFLSNLSHLYSQFHLLFSSLLSKPYFESIRHHSPRQRCCVDSCRLYDLISPRWNRDMQKKNPLDFNHLRKHLDNTLHWRKAGKPTDVIISSLSARIFRCLSCLTLTVHWQTCVWRSVSMCTPILRSHTGSYVLLLYFDPVKNWPSMHVSDRHYVVGKCLNSQNLSKDLNIMSIICTEI